MCTSSRKLLRRSPVKVAVSVVHRAGLRLPGGLGRGWVECWGRAATSIGGFHAARARARRWDGLHSSPSGNFCTDPRLKSRFRPRIGPGCGCRGAGPWVGHWSAGGRVQADSTSRHAREGGEGVCARGAVGWTALPTKSGVRYFPSIQKLASKARRPNRVAYRTHPAPASRRRSASAASHTARSSHSPSAVARCRAHPRLPAFPLCRLCTGLRRSAGGGICARVPNHAPTRPPARSHAALSSPRPSAPRALALTPHLPAFRCSDCALWHGALQVVGSPSTRSHGRALERIAGH